ncbi:hypothetical protein NDU88_004653 [Pleurodeles waltl]|uniref:Uncharacterized protein n=1 Tax=Pleurodeles waltl TaxID=8319 RepID=A0AAV7W8S4_PLEWA|nr:hypothetical protein NDU88_004653 [Pleurodeles waltl]
MQWQPVKKLWLVTGRAPWARRDRSTDQKRVGQRPARLPSRPGGTVGALGDDWGPRVCGRRVEAPVLREASLAAALAYRNPGH